jgi:hypothetical protein
MLKRIVVLIVGVMFALTSLPVLAADQWGVIKDKNGKCKVISMKKGATPKTIAGPFATKDEASKAKKEKCPSTEQKKK